MFFFAFASLFLVAISWLWATQRTRWWRLPRRALFAANPRRARALARIYARGSSPERRVALALVEANALLWEGELARALALLDGRVDLQRPPPLASTSVRLQCLVFDERYDEVRALFAAHEGALRASGSRGRSGCWLLRFIERIWPAPGQRLRHCRCRRTT